MPKPKLELLAGGACWCPTCRFHFGAPREGDNCPRCEDLAPTPVPPRLVALMDTFHALESAPRTTMHALAMWGCGGGTGCVVRFILSVYDPDEPAWFGLKPFRLHECLARMDEQHQRAFAAWAADPWWL